MKNNFDYIILTNPHRESLALPHFKDKNPKIFLSEDWEYTPPNNNFPHGNEVGAYRCFKSHSMGLQMMEKDIAFVMEDDCIPDYNQDWEGALESGYKLLNETDLEVACFYLNPHGQHPKNHSSQRIVNGFTWHEPMTKMWFVGAVCYMIKKSSAHKIILMDHFKHRIPVDVLLWQTHIFKYAAIDPSPFIHDRSQGSILENAK
jgi:GR25 family glycosyltransferase involved in LPS biosynthesis